MQRLKQSIDILCSVFYEFLDECLRIFFFFLIRKCVQHALFWVLQY